MALNAGDTLNNDHYRIIRQLGRGGFGFVYLAQDTLLGEQVAIKELIPALVGDETMLKRFLAEARATMRLTHERIVRTHNVFRESGNYYIVMECMAGDSLEALLRERGPLPIDEAVRVVAEVCEGLAYAHERGVVHCDLKPANILFDREGHAKVADFGIAHVSSDMLTRTWMTPKGFVAGTLPYMSPEQADGVRDDPRIDVYAVGAVLYRMLTGRTYLEFDERETPGATADNVYRIRNQEPQPPGAHASGLPDWVDRVVLRALAKHPDARYASAEAMRAALLQQPGSAPSVSPLPPSTKLTPTRRQAVAALTPPQQAPSHPAASAASATPRSSRLPAWFWPAVVVAVVVLVFLIIAIAALGRGADGGTVSGAGTVTDARPTDTVLTTSTSMRTPEPEIGSTATAMPSSTLTDTSRRTPTHTPRPTTTPTVTPVPTTPVPRPTSPAASATQTPVGRSTALPTQEPNPTPSRTAEPSFTCKPPTGNEEVYAEIIYPTQDMSLKTTGTIDIIGTATGRSFDRYTLLIMYDWARCEEVYGYYGGPNCSGRYTAEFRYPVVCDVLYTLDPSTWRKFSTDEYRVRIFLESVKPDANYDRSTVLFWLER